MKGVSTFKMNIWNVFSFFKEDESILFISCPIDNELCLHFWLKRSNSCWLQTCIWKYLTIKGVPAKLDIFTNALSSFLRRTNQSFSFLVLLKINGCILINEMILADYWRFGRMQYKDLANKTNMKKSTILSGFWRTRPLLKPPVAVGYEAWSRTFMGYDLYI